MKPGTIIESYQGQFAKVIRVKNGLTHFTAWVKTKALAEQEEVAVNRLNEFGMSQVLKGGKHIAVGDDTAVVEEAKDEKTDGGDVVAVGKMKVGPLRQLAKDLELDTDGTKAELVKRITEAMQAEVDAMVDHTVTEEDLTANPALVEFGVAVGDVVKRPKAAA